MLDVFFVKIKSVFREDIIFFILLFVLLSITDVYNNVEKTQYFKCLYNLINAFVFSGLACIILSYIDKYKKLRKYLNFIVLLFVIIYSVVNIYTIVLTLNPFNHGVIELFISTNYNEVLEFIKAYLSIYLSHFVDNYSIGFNN